MLTTHKVVHKLTGAIYFWNEPGYIYYDELGTKRVAVNEYPQKYLESIGWVFEDLHLMLENE